MINAGNKTDSQINAEIANNNFVNQIEKLHAHYNECAKKFIEEPKAFAKLMAKIVKYSKQNKNHLDLAKDIGFPGPLVAHIVSILLDEMKDKGDYCDKSIETAKSFVIEDKSPTENVVNIGLEDVGDFSWGDDMWVYNVPCDFDFPEGFNKNTSFDAFEGGWQIYLRLENYGNKHHIEASSKEEKLEIAEMLRLMNKYLD